MAISNQLRMPLVKPRGPAIADSMTARRLVVSARLRRGAGRDRGAAVVAANGDCAARSGRRIRSPREGDAFPGEGEERHLFVHGRGAEPSGILRQQARARQVRRPIAAAGSAQGLPGGVHQPEFEVSRAEVQIRPARPMRGRSCRNCCRIWRTWSTTSPSIKSMVDRRVQSRAGTDRDEHRQPAVRPTEPRGVDLLRPGQRIAGIAELHRVQLRQKRPQRRQFELGQRLLADASIRACSSARGGEPVLYLVESPRRRCRSCSEIRWTRSSELNREAAGCSSAIRKSPRESTRSRWPIACRPSAPDADGSRRASRSTSSICTAPSRASRRSPTIVCWHGG